MGPLQTKMLTPVTLKLGHGDTLSNKSEVISRCMFYVFKAFLGQLEVKILSKNASPSNIFDPGDPKTRSWWPIFKSVIDLVQMHVLCDFQLPRSKNTKAVMLLAVFGWLTDCLTAWPSDINAVKPSLKPRKNTKELKKFKIRKKSMAFHFKVVLNPGPKRIPQNLIKGKLYLKNDYKIICRILFSTGKMALYLIMIILNVQTLFSLDWYFSKW